MKRFLVLCLVAGVSFAAGRIFDGIPATAAAGGGQRGGGAAKCSSQNGDVNADGKVDLSDAVTILGYLFLGSPTQLVPRCPQPAAPSGLPDTGQTKCYDKSGFEIPCDSATCAGQDGFYATGCPTEGRFVDNGNGTVSDTCAGLMWQKDTADTNGEGKIDGADQLPWCAALAYCENRKFAGHTDWRLPNVRELQSIVDYGRSHPSIDPAFGALSVFYWTSTTPTIGNDLAWYVDFRDGFVNNVGGKGTSLYVRAVRNAP